jgi:hypothetical protein
MQPADGFAVCSRVRRISDQGAADRGEYREVAGAIAEALMDGLPLPPRLAQASNLLA